MPVSLGDTSISKLYLGSTEVPQAYLGSTQVFNSTPPNGLLNGLVSYYKADTNGSFPDVHGSNDGIINGATYTSNGKINGAYSFDGGNDYIGTGLLSRSNFTKSVWVRIVSSSSSGNIMGKYDGNSEIEQLYYSNNNGNIIHDFGRVGGARNQTSTGPISLNTWHHIVVTYDGIIAKMYLDGVMLSSNSTTPSNYIDTNTLDIGRRTDGSYFNGYIDEFLFSEIALSDDDVVTLYNSGNGLSYDNFTT